MRRYLTAGVALAMAGGLLVGCGGGDSAGASDEINLIMSNHPWQRAIEPLIGDFERESGMKVRVQTFAEQQMRDKVQLNLQSRSSAMDVFMALPSREGPQFARSNYYEPLDSYVSGAADYNVEDFPEAVRAGMTVDGKQIAAPINVEAVVLYYRKDLFQQYNLTPPTTLAELTSTAAAIKDRSNGAVTPIALRGQSTALPFTFGPFLHARGVEWTKEDKVTPNFDDPRAVEAIDQYATLAREYGPDGVVNNTFTQSSALMAAGNAAMMLESSNEVSSITDPGSSKVADDLGVVAFPAGEAGSRTTILSWGLAVSSFSQKKDAAWKFVEWATSAEVQQKLTESGIAPPRTSVAASEAYTASLDTDLLKEWNEVLTSAQTTGSTEVGPVGVAAPEMRKIIGDAVGLAILDRASAADAAKQIQDGLAPQLAKNEG
jgi:multiple sugar transport system substrate-binding protein